MQFCGLPSLQYSRTVPPRERILPAWGCVGGQLGASCLVRRNGVEKSLSR